MFGYRRPHKCPSCGRPIPRSAVQDGPFPCPFCDTELTISESYVSVIKYVAIAIAAVTAYGAGLRGQMLFVGIAVGSLPTMVIIGLLNSWLFPPDVTVTGNVATIIRGVASAGDDEPGSHSPPLDPSHADTSTGLGWVRLIFAAVVLVGWVWMNLRSFQHYFGGESTAPPDRADVVVGFPADAPISLETSGIEIINNSRLRWTCTLDIGWTNIRRASIPVDRRSSAYLLYQEFGRGSDIDLRRTASERLVVTCADERGQSRQWTVAR